MGADYTFNLDGSEVGTECNHAQKDDDTYDTKAPSSPLYYLFCFHLDDEHTELASRNVGSDRHNKRKQPFCSSVKISRLANGYYVLLADRNPCERMFACDKSALSHASLADKQYNTCCSVL